MSGFGRPPGALTFSPTPPQRGAFPLDHDGECKPIMTEYLACLKRVKGTNDMACRLIAKEYLRCRMERQLMAEDSFENLGFQDEKKTPATPSAAVPEARSDAAAAASSSASNRLEELKRENARLVEERKKQEAEKR
ncbi:hypothetical protein BZA77DRAFT_301290 [Pyronema omphalodes]|nr:hypothetical protein BZA77DRAFT_301290 [Pyronema omphalodes]